MQISYKEILKQAWQITLKNKILWLFGFFASFISLESAYEIIIKQAGQAGQFESLRQQILNLYPSRIDFINKNVYALDLLPRDLPAFIAFCLVIFCIVFFIWLIFISQITIVKSAAQLYKKNKLITHEAFHVALEKFWPVLGLNILAKLFIYAGFIALSLPLLYSILVQSQLYIIITQIAFLLFFIVWSVLISFLAAYATNFIVLKNLHILEAIKESWLLFTKNTLLSLEVAFILFFFKILSFIIILCIFLLVLAPLSVAMLFSLANNSLIGIFLSLTLIILAFVLILAVISAAFTVFYLASWTTTFIKITEESYLSKILNFIRNIPGLFRKKAREYNLEIDKKQIKKEAKKIAKTAEAEAKILTRKIEQKYTELKPQFKKQSKILVKKIKAGYEKIEPVVEKKIKEMINQKIKTKKSSLKKKKDAQSSKK